MVSRWQTKASAALSDVIEPMLELGGRASLQDGVATDIAKLLSTVDVARTTNDYLVMWGSCYTPAALDAAASKNWPLAYSILFPEDVPK